MSILTREIFGVPRYMAPSAWSGHIPFAFWLIANHRPRVLVELGVHYGVSYFAFCQAIDEQKVDARAYGVDHWKGDAHAGAYDENVYQQVRSHNDSQYSLFSSLIRSSFDEACEHFSEKSIDLLHIDGHHTYESVRHDYEQWEPYLSDRAIVLFHDTNVREREFGVGRYFSELATRHPSFEFIHGYGLGVLFKGTEITEEVRHLMQSVRMDADRVAIREAFARLGTCCIKDQELLRLKTLLEVRNGALNDERGARTELLQTARSLLKRLKVDVDELGEVLYPRRTPK